MSVDSPSSNSSGTATSGPDRSSPAKNSSPKRPPFTLVIPAYNEERRLPTSIRDIKAFFKNVSDPIEVLVVVEKSKDRTFELALAAAADDPRIKVIDNQVHRGKGYAVKSGMMRAQGEIVFFNDADLSTPLAEIFVFLGHFNEHPETDIIIGSRAHAQSQILKRQNWFRQLLGRTFNKFVQFFGVRGIKDTQCGFKAFRLQACRDIFRRQTLNGFAFDVEVLMIAEEMGYKIDIQPVRWINSPDSKVRILIDPLKMLVDLVRTRRLVRKTLRLTGREKQPLS
jgi:dolichyl-phosphate beta-glucosyltransferase